MNARPTSTIDDDSHSNGDSVLRIRRTGLVMTLLMLAIGICADTFAADPRAIVDCNNNGIDDAHESLGLEEIDRIDAPAAATWGTEISLDLAGPGHALIGDSNDDAVYSYTFDCETIDPFDDGRLTKFTGVRGSKFGYSVASTFGEWGDKIVGAPGYNGGNGIDAGIAYAIVGFACFDPYHTQTVALIAPNPDAGDQFGVSVQLGETITNNGRQFVVGAPGDDDAGSDAGAVFLFHLDWIEIEPFYLVAEPALDQTLTASDSADSDRFGMSIAVSQNLMAVSAPGVDSGLGYTGAVYVFRQIDGTWIEEAKITPAQTASMTSFGEQVAADGNRIIVSVPVPPGAASTAPIIGPFVFHFDGSNWNEEAAFTPPPAPPDVNSRAYVGISDSIAISGDLIAWYSPAYLDIGPNGPLLPVQMESVETRHWNGNEWIADPLFPLPPATVASNPLRYGLSLSGNHLATAHVDQNTVLMLRRCLTTEVLGDIDNDGDVDMDDATALAAVLLDIPQTPAHVDRSDLNDDGAQNGMDIQLFVDAWLAQ